MRPVADGLLTSFLICTGFALAATSLSACGGEFSNCNEARSCRGAPDAAAPDAGGSGGERNGYPGSTSAEGTPCEDYASLACAGAAQKVVLFCDGSTWQIQETCSRDQNCDTQAPSCAPIVAACDGHEPGYKQCVDGAVVTCGPDLVTTETQACDGECVSAACLSPLCGDHIVQSSLDEACDDGNDVDTDDCPSTCQTATCGDGFTLAGVEACDDGNGVDTDACPSTCQNATCGDGFTLAGTEGCDDANDVDTDACSSTCEPASCGDGVVWEGQESCDPGSSTDCRQTACRWIWDLSNYACALQRTTGLVKCWGAGLDGRLGQGNTDNLGDDPDEMGANLAAIDLGTGRTARHVSTRTYHACAVLDDDQVKCWGENGSGQLGLGHPDEIGDHAFEMGDELRSVDLGTGPSVPVRTAVGSNHSCVLFNDGKIKCWGLNQFGELGLGNTDDRGDDPDEMGDALPFLPFFNEATDLVANYDYNCALFSNKKVRCWGRNDAGQLGLGNWTNHGDAPGEVNEYVDLGVDVQVQSLSAGLEHVCAVLTDQTIKCWGGNYYGQLGLGNEEGRGDEANELGDNLPRVDLGTGEKAVMVSAGVWHTCALLARGAVKCWGNAQFGQLGLGLGLENTPESIGASPGEMGDALPVVDLGGQKAVSVHAFDYSTCAQLEDGSLRCWGNNKNADIGVLGVGDSESRGLLPDQMGTNLAELRLD